MGGYLIRDILEADKKIVSNLKDLILQPVQNAEIVREYLYKSGYHIIDEDICFEEGKYYEAMKVVYDPRKENYNDNEHIENSIYFEIGKILLKKKNPLIKDFIKYKINKYTIIKDNISANSINAQSRLQEIEEKIISLKELL